MPRYTYTMSCTYLTPTAEKILDPREKCCGNWNVVYHTKGLLFPEGQLPRGALYLDHKMNSKEAEKPYVSPHQICKSVFIVSPCMFLEIILFHQHMHCILKHYTSTLK